MLRIRNRHLLLLIVLSLLVAIPLSAQSIPSWQRIETGLPLTLDAIAARDSTVFASAPGYGLYAVSTIGGQWRSVFINPSFKVEHLVATSFGVLATGFEEDYTRPVVYVYDAGGWSRVLSLPSSTPTIFGAVDVGRTIYLYTDNGVLRSKDKAKTWSVCTFPPGTALESLIAVGLELWILGDDGTSCYRSTDDGNTWSAFVPKTNAPSGTIYNLQAVSKEAVWLATESGTVYRSLDNGESWAMISAGLAAGSLVSNIVSSGGATLLSTRQGDIYELSPSGVWTTRSGGLPQNKTIRPSRLVAIDGGFYLSPSPGYPTVYALPVGSERWSENREGLPSNVGVSSIVSLGDLLLLTSSSGDIFSSKDKGTRWEKTMDGIPINERILALAGANTTVITTVIAGGIGGTLYRSINGGTTWNVVQGSAFAPRVRIQTLSIAGNVFVAGTETGIAISADNGLTWRSVVENAGSATFSQSVNGSFFMATTLRGILRSDDNGVTWADWNTGLSRVDNEYGITSLSKMGTALLTSVNHPLLGFRSTYKTSVSKADWQQTNNYIIQASTTSVRGTDTITLGGTISEGVFRLYNDAIDCQPFGLSKSVQSLWADNTYALAGTTTGLYRANLLEATTGIGSANKGTKVSCFPNPASEITTISFDLQLGAEISLRITDMSGRIIRETQSGYRGAGNQKISLDLREVSEGAYTITVIADMNPVASVMATVVR